MRQMYEVWRSTGQGTTKIDVRMRTLEQALRYVALHRLEASFAIRDPEGNWRAISPRNQNDRSVVSG